MKGKASAAAENQTLSATFAAMVERLDAGVGRILADLEQAGELGRTLILFTSDNGMNLGAHRMLGKFTPYSVDVPLFVHWPTALGTAPRRVNELSANVDLAPTLCAVAGWLRLPFWPCLAYMAIGKFLRYLVMTGSLLWIPDSFWHGVGEAIRQWF
mgnify:CR=1 FL=1